MGRHALRPRRAPLPWIPAVVLGLVAGAVTAGALTWGGAHPSTVIGWALIAAVGTGGAHLLAARVTPPDDDAPGTPGPSDPVP